MNLQNAIIDKVSTLKDGSVRISLVTRALSPTQMAEIFYSVNQEILSIDIDEEKKEDKSPSQRLRWVLYKLWEQSTDKDSYNNEFELFYRAKMERIIDTLKDKIS